MLRTIYDELSRIDYECTDEQEKEFRSSGATNSLNKAKEWLKAHYIPWTRINKRMETVEMWGPDKQRTRGVPLTTVAQNLSPVRLVPHDRIRHIEDWTVCWIQNNVSGFQDSYLSHLTTTADLLNWCETHRVNCQIISKEGQIYPTHIRTSTPIIHPYKDPHMPTFNTQLPPNRIAEKIQAMKKEVFEEINPPQSPSTTAAAPEPSLPQSYQVGGTHYKSMEIEPWTVIKSWLSPEEWIGFLRGNILKYQGRARAGKGTVEENLRKANHYTQMLDLALNESQPQTTETSHEVNINLPQS